MTQVRPTDERLAWLAVRDEIQRLTTPSIWLRILGARGRGRPGDGGDFARELSADKRNADAFAVDDAARLLRPEERQVLRQTGRVPEWFLPEVQRRVRAG